MGVGGIHFAEEDHNANLGKFLSEDDPNSFYGEDAGEISGSYFDSESEKDGAQVMMMQEEQASIDEAQNVLMLPWYENIQEKLIKLEASRWVKMNMVRISKQLGIKSGETG